jgi:TPR repeat protein
MYNSNLIRELCNKDINEIYDYLNNSYYADLHKNFLNRKKLSVNQKLFIGLYFFHIEKNYGEAKKYYLMASNKGNSYAISYLGLYHQIGENYEEAKKYYLMAIDKGNSDAMYNLGFYYEDIENNYEEAKKYYLMAIDKDKSKSYAMTRLGNYYYIQKNYEEAKNYYLVAINKGDSHAMNRLGLYYSEIEENHEEANKYYLMAIDKGDACAFYNLGLYYYDIEKNYEEAKKYLLMAIHKKFFASSYAMIKLGKYYGEIEKNYEEAKKYYLMAINNGHPNAMKSLKKIEKKIFFQKINENKDYDKIEQSNICLICKCEKNILINFNCDTKHDHYYCHECVNKWYEDNDLKCLLCFCEINTDYIKFEQCDNAK